ncbi:MAG: restriction endonuclease [bacterium]
MKVVKILAILFSFTIVIGFYNDDEIGLFVKVLVIGIIFCYWLKYIQNKSSKTKCANNNLTEPSFKNKGDDLSILQNNSTNKEIIYYNCDPMFKEIYEFTITLEKISTSLLQRNFLLGYNKAAQFIKLLQEQNVISTIEESPGMFKIINKTRKKFENANIKEDSKTNYITDEDILKKYNLIPKYNDKEDYISNIKNVLICNAINDDEKELVIKNLIEFNSPKEVKLILIDYNKLSFNQFNGLYHLLYPVITDEKKIMITLEKIINQQEKRLDFCATNFIKKFEDYRKVDNIPYIIIIIDEIYPLIKNKEFYDLLLKILMRGPKVGIKLILFSKLNNLNLKLNLPPSLLEICTRYDVIKVMNIKKQITKNCNDLELIDNKMNGFEFEEYSKYLLENNNFQDVFVTSSSGDFGVDIVAFKDDVKYAIQCKKYTGTVGIKAVQEVIASKSVNDCHVAAVLTNSTFTKSAIELAYKNNVLLWDREYLCKMIESQNKQVKEKL